MQGSSLVFKLAKMGNGYQSNRLEIEKSDGKVEVRINEPQEGQAERGDIIQ